mmetsp:Transcript_11852/g.16947  ORF Transcript_11852/g.16947 Transcript_11852/m.16947 type:complete len:121 (+) Transcript_11852:3-365(+)
MIEPTCELMNKWRTNGNPVTHLRENVKLAKRCEAVEWKLNVKVEFTASHTPQQNSCAEVGIAVVYNRAKALMFRANVPSNARSKLFGEACKTAALLDRLQVANEEIKPMTRFEYEWGKNP